jgi:hypothetical protein
MLPPVIEGVMSEIQFCNERQAYAALSLLLDEPESEVAKCFTAPSRLRRIRIIDSHPWRYPLTLNSFFQGTENLTDVLEVVHYSRAGMLHRLSELSLFWSMLPNSERMLCHVCLAVGNIPCPKCNQPMLAGRKKQCESCYWKELLLKCTTIDCAGFAVPAMALHFFRFGEWLGGKVGIHKAAITLHCYLPFFVEIEKQW